MAAARTLFSGVITHRSTVNTTDNRCTVPTARIPVRALSKSSRSTVGSVGNGVKASSVVQFSSSSPLETSSLQASRRLIATRAARDGLDPASPTPVEPEVDIAADVGVLVLRVGVGLLMFHNGLDKLQDPEGFSTFVVAKYLSFLPAPLVWTYLAAGAELVGPVGLVLGAFTRFSSLALLGTMGLAVIFHINDTGLQGFPLAVVPEHQYSFEPAALYALIFAYFVANGGGKFSVDNLLNKNKDK